MNPTSASVVSLELNEAELYLLQKFVAAGKLPSADGRLLFNVLACIEEIKRLV